MLKCMICSATAPDDATTCPACGEASWDAVAAAAPKSIDSQESQGSSGAPAESAPKTRRAKG